MNTSIEERMSKIDKTIWNKLHASIKPHLNRIEREKDKLKSSIQKTTEIIDGLKAEISDYQKMITEIEDKYREPESIEESVEESSPDNVSEDSQESFEINTEISMSPENLIDGSNNFLREEYSE